MNKQNDRKSDPNKLPPLDDLRQKLGQPNQESSRVRQARKIESRAGQGLQRDYWMSQIETPFGKFSLRSLIFVFVGVFSTCLVLGLAARYIITNDASRLDMLPKNDAQTVGSHVFTRFSGQKSGPFEPYVPIPEQTWNFVDAKTFTWTDGDEADEAEDPHQVIIASYRNLSALTLDYISATRPLNTEGHKNVIFRHPELGTVNRNLPDFGGEWRGLYLSNILVLVSASTSLDAQQEIFSHVVSIVAANHRESIPTATPVR